MLDMPTANDVVSLFLEILRDHTPDQLLVFTTLSSDARESTLDPELLRQICLELVRNLERSMPDGGVLYISTERIAVDGRRVQDWPDLPSGDYTMVSVTVHNVVEGARVRDGPPEFEFRNMFAIAKRGGAHMNVTIHSSGSTVLRILAPQGDTSPSKLSMLPRGKGRSKTILLAGSTNGSRSDVRKRLLAEGYAVFEALHDRHAETILSSFAYEIDLIVLDLEGDEVSNPLPAWVNIMTTVPVIVLAEGRLWRTVRGEPHARWTSESDDYIASVRDILGAPHTAKRILVVDDQESMRRLITAVLENAGYEVLQARHGREALVLLREHRPDVVLTELVLPEIEGLQLIQELRKPDRRLPVVAMSGSVRAETYLSAAKALGANATLRKPFPVDELLQTLHQIIENSRQ